MPAAGLSRRELISGAVTCSALLATCAGLQGCTDGAKACADPEELSTAELQLRRTLEYTSSASDSRRCDNCQFFSPGQQNCGECELLSGPVATGGWCSSWAAQGG